MPKIATILLCSASVFGALACAPAMAQTATAADRSPAPASASNQGDQGQDIVVTATKRDERLRDVPSAITALTSETLSTQGVQDFRDYATLVPGLAQRDLGGPGLGVVILRGLNTGPNQATPTTAFYLGETPFTAAGFITNSALFTPAPDVSDLERIEVLKGPQGTLYGASSLGGLVRFVFKKPDATRLSGDGRADFSAVDGGGVGYGIHAAINLPLVNNVLAVRASGFYRRAPGFVDNVATGTQNINRSDLYGGRVALRFTPSADLAIDLSGEVENIDTGGYNQVDTVSGTLTPIYGPYKYSNFRDFGYKLQYRLASATLDYDVGPGSIVATANYAYYHSFIEADYTNSYVPLARASLASVSTALFGVPINTLIPANSTSNGTNSPQLKKFSAETRFVSRRLGPVEFVAGGFYTHEDNYVPIFSTSTTRTACGARRRSICCCGARVPRRTARLRFRQSYLLSDRPAGCNGRAPLC